MTGEGHIIFAIASAIFAKRAELTPVLAQADWWHLVPSALLTCLLPDIDHPKSLLGQRLRWLSQPIARAFGHRGFTHSLLAVAAGLWLFQINLPKSSPIPPDVLQGLTLGYLSHIVADMLTPAGVPLLWPCRWRFRLPILRSQKGNQLERVLCLGLVGYALWFPVGMPSFGANGWPSQLFDTLQNGVGRLISSHTAQ
ncbi:MULTISPECIES: metal-dependent hydrolase [Pantoea]|uniref:metal-dependent hydrolase n=1 Tax=Pantoea TaxID=53335 RepID=UPI001231F43E|nr:MULTISPECIES: metal-dependent hydrolase [Pantoea]KAA5969445.1 metal-dependent hydrolase [Pantoea sp. M_6]KAA5975665.1 metal-dependent hydrolase [Pantoea sp. M_8]KAA5992290.1 metal-dependent hydrolase [Pantoea sp. M_5]KAA5993881.1 metal-dependent hydrolase [Pantoea sp. M_10]MEB6225029.1 metal-dependent hydrolase [Pantoea anthophila]